MKSRLLMRILWPSFLMAGVTGGIVFALVDPQDVPFLGHIWADRQLVYAAGFFLFWLMAALSSALSLHIGLPCRTDRNEYYGSEDD